MSQKNIGIGLIVFGIFTLLFAFNMSVSVEGSDVINFHMISERQNTLVLGGIVFLGGIILFALARLKQTEAEDAIEKSKQHDRSENAKRIIGEVNTAIVTRANTTASEFSDSSADVWSKVSPFFVTGNDNIIGRIAVALFVGSCVWFLGQIVYSIDISWFVFLAFAFAYSMRSIPSLKAILHLLILNAIVISLSVPFAFARVIHWERMAYVLSVPLVLSCWIIWFIKTRETKYAESGRIK